MSLDASSLIPLLSYMHCSLCAPILRCVFRLGLYCLKHYYFTLFSWPERRVPTKHKNSLAGARHATVWFFSGRGSAIVAWKLIGTGHPKIDENGQIPAELARCSCRLENSFKFFFKFIGIFPSFTENLSHKYDSDFRVQTWTVKI